MPHRDENLGTPRWLGVTGHQRLDDPSGWTWVRTAMSATLDGIVRPVAVTSLAVGADQLFAELVLARGGRVHAVIPFSGYERIFADADRSSYEALLAQATAETLPWPAQGDKEAAYLAAGKRVVNLSDAMIAVWDGQPAKGRGGTADIVAYCAARGIPVVHIDPVQRVVKHLK